MSEHSAALSWRRESPTFEYKTYNRRHDLRFKDGRIRIVGDALPEFLGGAEGPDPEELFAAALAACHMLAFLAVAARMRLPAATYDDEPVALLEKDASSKMRVTRVTLRPRVTFDQPVDAAKLAQLHELAHANCFLASAVTSQIVVEPRPA